MSICERCQGNGEIVTDWERYRHPYEGDKGDEAVAKCPDCGGEGILDPAAEALETLSIDTPAKEITPDMSPELSRLMSRMFKEF